MRFHKGIWRREPEISIVTPQPQFEGRISWQLGLFTEGRNIVRRSSESDFRNLITNVGLDSMNNTGIDTSTQFVSVGTGSTAPANAQTAMISEIARTSRRSTGNGVIASGAAFAYWSIKQVYLFLETEANGNLTEVGFFNQITTGTMFSRQLFKDVTGTPTTVVKTASDQLKITYEIRCYPPTVDTTQSGVVISGTSYDITTRAREIDSALIWGYDSGTTAGFLLNVGRLFVSAGGRAYEGTATLGTTTGSLIGASAGADTSVAGGYTNGNYYRDVTMKWEPGNANFATGIGGIHSHGGGTTELFQSLFTPAFTKDATKRLTLVVRCAWARYP